MNKERIKVIKKDSERWFETAVAGLMQEGYVPRFETYRVVYRSGSGTLIYSMLMELKDETI